jgi:iron(III) transport system ATP-binding protein
MPGVVISGLTKRFGDIAAVAGLDLTVRPGELVALLGPSGCGKTTTLRLVERRRMAMIFQSYALWPHMTVAQNVAYGLRFTKASRGMRDGAPARARRDVKVEEILRAVQLTGYGARYPGELSGGQQQRVAVARALVVEPEILLLDEPLSNLDASLREEMRFEIRRLHERFGITTLYVTHDQAEAMVISDRAAVIRHGRVEQIGAPQELFERPRTRFVAEFIGKTNLIDAVADGPATVARGRLRLRVAADGLTPGTPAVVSIRPHLIVLGPRADTGPPAGANALAGTVRRASYLGETVDYQVALEDSDVTLRVAGPTPARARAGDPVTLTVPAEACILLPADD